MLSNDSENIRKTANINVQKRSLYIYRHVNGKIAQLKEQISELGFLAVLQVDIDNVHYN